LAASATCALYVLTDGGQGMLYRIELPRADLLEDRSGPL
jgi:hypothetical protein